MSLDSCNVKSKIGQLRLRVSDVLTVNYDTDFNLLRWLQAFDFDLENAQLHLRNHLRFQQSCWNFDEIQSRNEGVHSYWRWGLLGEGRRGRNQLIYVEQSGQNDVSGFMKSFSMLELCRARLIDYELMLHAVMELEKQTGKQGHIIFVMDLEGLKFDSSLLGIMRGPLKIITNLLQEHYPQLVGKFVVVNAPIWFYQAWRIFKPLMPAGLPNKVKVLSSDWRQEILQFAVPEILPKFWGPEFGVEVERPPRVPPSLYCTNTKLFSSKIQSITVLAGKSEFVIVKVENVGEVLKFGVHASCGDFGFGVFYSENKTEKDVDKMEMVYPQFSRCVGPTYMPLVDQFGCNKSGYYKLWLGNENAWWSSAKFECFVETY